MSRFFLFFIFRSKNREGLLNLVIAGLILSSLSLLILQGVMGGLQTKLKDRSKKIEGDKVVYLSLKGAKNISLINTLLKSHGVDNRIENEHEGILSFKGHLIPAIVHGVYEGDDTSSWNLSNGSIVPFEVMRLLGAAPGSALEFYSPSYTDSFFNDIPRSFSFTVSNVITTMVPELDSSHIWIKASKLNNLMREVTANRIRIFSEISSKRLRQLLSPFVDVNEINIKKWDEIHSSLVWALKLEKLMMTFLFIAMSFLICLSISSAVLVFIKKVNRDLTAMWVLGASKSTLTNTSQISLFLLCLVSIFIGIFLGTVILELFDRYSGEIMPDIFVERKIPIKFSASMYMISFFIPSIMSWIFVFFGLNHFKKENDYLKNVRSIGQV